MSGHVSWARARAERLARLDAVQRAAFEVGQRLSRERLDRETWLAEVEGWLSRALTAAGLNLEVESLAWPWRTLEDLDRLAEDEYGDALHWIRASEAAGMTWEELRREANVMLLTDYVLEIDKTEGLPPAWRQTRAEARAWAERFWDREFPAESATDDWPAWERDAHGRPPDDPHHGHEHS